MLPVVSRASGVFVFDTEGREYLDGCSGAINVNLGHGLPDITKRMHEQLDRVNFVYRTQFRSQPLLELTERLVDLAPGDLNHVEFTNSGSEGIEMALRLVTLLHARKHNPLKCVVLTEEPSYHGMTAGALGASGHPLRRKDLQSLLANQATVARVRPKNGALRASVEDWQEAVDRIGPARLGAVIIEPVGGAASGAAPCDSEVLRFLRHAADEQRFVLVADEVMTGMGRTGRWFGCDHAGITPDVMVLGKGISAGYAAISAVLVSDRIVRALDRPVSSLVFGHTMAGAPLAAAAALAVTEYLVTHDLAARAAVAGEHLAGLLKRLCQRHPLVKDVRGTGLQRGLGLHGDPERFPGISLDLTEAARAKGLLVYPAGCTPVTESVLIAPPLTSTDAELDELARRLDGALSCLSPTPGS
ncbi:aminotransferase class III-fold pyridoxal phosphate-dependent enzyme [Streptomyces buecherae]|uniref:aminotransferase class III-fold pyridoxal phosphate-dependent enzyme n=1 Tax=Streptomyces buecherae TaxID=2763006 RepID=UPI00378FBD61